MTFASFCIRSSKTEIVIEVGVCVCDTADKDCAMQIVKHDHSICSRQEAYQVTLWVSCLSNVLYTLHMCKHGMISYASNSSCLSQLRCG